MVHKKTSRKKCNHQTFSESQSLPVIYVLHLKVRIQVFQEMVKASKNRREHNTHTQTLNIEWHVLHLNTIAITIITLPFKWPPGILKKKNCLNKNTGHGTESRTDPSFLFRSRVAWPQNPHLCQPHLPRMSMTIVMIKPVRGDSAQKCTSFCTEIQLGKEKPLQAGCDLTENAENVSESLI